MRSKIFRPAVLGLLVLLLVAGSAPLLAGANPSERAATGFVDIVNYGTDWNPEVRSHFRLWKYLGWGTDTRLKAARAPGYEWVHIPITLVSYVEGSPMYIDKVEFCAKSSNGLLTKPTDIHLWSDAGRFYTGTVTWANNNNKQCWSVDLTPNVWKESLGVSVRLYFANSTDTITLMKAWAHLVP